MMKTKAPLRISFAGGGTDIEPYVSKHGGFVLSAAVNIYAYAEYPVFNKTATGLENTIAHYFNRKGSDLWVYSEAPPMSGLGGSASCFVAGIKAIRPDMEGKELADLAIYLERDVMGVAGGKQDQYAAAFGGVNFMEFSSSRVKIQPVKCEWLEDLLVLVYMGQRKHNGHDIILDQMSRDNLDNFNYQKDIVKRMLKAIAKKDIWNFGNYINLSWQSKIRFSPYITNPYIDEFREDALKHGALAGKLTGAGGGGYMLLMIDPEKKGQLIEFLKSRYINYQQTRFAYEGARCL